MSHTYTLSDFDFELPEALIAQHPAAERSASRLLDGREATPADRIFKDLPSLLRAGDLLVFNDTQVVKARLFGEKPTGGKLELLVERVLVDALPAVRAETVNKSDPKAVDTASNYQVVAHMKVSKKPPIPPGGRDKDTHAAVLAFIGERIRAWGGEIREAAPPPPPPQA